MKFVICELHECCELRLSYKVEVDSPQVLQEAVKKTMLRFL